MPESDRAFTGTIVHLCESIFYHYLQMHFMRMKLFFCPPQGITSSASRREIFLPEKKRLIWLLQHAAFEIGHI